MELQAAWVRVSDEAVSRLPQAWTSWIALSRARSNLIDLTAWSFSQIPTMKGRFPSNMIPEKLAARASKHCTTPWCTPTVDYKCAGGAPPRRCTIWNMMSSGKTGTATVTLVGGHSSRIFYEFSILFRFYINSFLPIIPDADAPLIRSFLCFISLHSSILHASKISYTSCMKLRIAIPSCMTQSLGIIKSHTGPRVHNAAN